MEAPLVEPPDHEPIAVPYVVVHRTPDPTDPVFLLQPFHSSSKKCGGRCGALDALEHPNSPHRRSVLVSKAGAHGCHQTTHGTAVVVGEEERPVVSRPLE